MTAEQQALVAICEALNHLLVLASWDTAAHREALQIARERLQRERLRTSGPVVLGAG